MQVRSDGWSSTAVMRRLPNSRRIHRCLFAASIGVIVLCAPSRTVAAQTGIRPKAPWRGWAFARAGAGSNAPGSVATSGAGALVAISGGIVVSHGLAVGMVRISDNGQWDGFGVRDRALLAGIRSRGEHFFVVGAAGLAQATPFITSDGGGSTGAAEAALAYDLSAHAAYGAGLSLAVSGAVGPAKTSYVSLSLGVELGMFGF
jgi:hypothetical protein